MVNVHGVNSSFLIISHSSFGSMYCNSRDSLCLVPINNLPNEIILYWSNIFHYLYQNNGTISTTCTKIMKPLPLYVQAISTLCIEKYKLFSIKFPNLPYEYLITQSLYIIIDVYCSIVLVLWHQTWDIVIMSLTSVSLLSQEGYGSYENYV